MKSKLMLSLTKRLITLKNIEEGLTHILRLTINTKNCLPTIQVRNYQNTPTNLHISLIITYGKIPRQFFLTKFLNDNMHY